MNIFTKRGDAGKTSLYGGTEVFKDDPRVWCYGTVDEANSVLALIYSSLEFDDLRAIVRKIQNRLFVVGAELAGDERQREKNSIAVGEEDVLYLENLISAYTEEFGKLTGFSLPGESPVSSMFHLARTVVRRAERHVVGLARDEQVSPVLLKYLNRLSDAMYVLAKMEVYRGFIKRVVKKLKELETGESEYGNCGTIFTAVLCERLRQAGQQESAKIGVPVSLAIVDQGANLVYFYRFPKASLVSIKVAVNKAYTAVAMEQPSGNLYDPAVPGGSLYGINTADPRIVVFGGGFPLFVDGRIAGGLGVSGGSVSEDEQIGRRVVAEFEKLVKQGNGGDYGSTS
ncbi:MAG: cob(I)yrinic acid a,c-diamide adenosyltransferase [Spirochaetaceae bacterium]|nr:cob(I)yrinic acid a,c-diamide adenosyltransferase [Spirochaetaceae bacterium]